MNQSLPLSLMAALERERFDLVAVVGPTGSGKSRLALSLADRVGGEIINCDSRQVYRDFPIITAQPDQAEQLSCPHHLYGFLETRTKMTAGWFKDLAEDKLSAIKTKKAIPILVGGTGLYLRALLDGLPAIPAIPEAVKASLRDELAAFGPLGLYQRLAANDPDYAAKIHPNNTRHLLRALEVFTATGRTFSWWHGQHRAGRSGRHLIIGLKLDPQRKTEILAARIDDMMARGALREASMAWESCPDSQAPGWSGIGCAELAAWLEGRVDLAGAISQWLANTNAYSKRQMTWFKAAREIVWL